MKRLLALLLVLNGCGFYAGARYANPVPFETAGGGGGHVGLIVGESPHSEPAFTYLTEVEGGEWGWRYAGHFGVMGPLGETFFARAGISPFSMGHLSDDPDPDPWVGVSGTLQIGAWNLEGDNESYFEAGLGLSGDLAWSGEGHALFLVAFIGGGSFSNILFVR